MTQLCISVCYAEPNRYVEIPLRVEKSCTVAVAIKRSNILADLPHLDFPNIAVGVFGKRVKLDDLLHDGDRIELYRPLTISPKEARRLRAKKA